MEPAHIGEVVKSNLVGRQNLNESHSHSAFCRAVIVGGLARLKNLGAFSVCSSYFHEIVIDVSETSNKRSHTCMMTI